MRQWKWCRSRGDHQAPEQITQTSAGQAGSGRAHFSGLRLSVQASGAWLTGRRVQKGWGLSPQGCLPDCPASTGTPFQALLHLLLLYGLVVSTALIWHPINKLAAVLLLPYLAWLTVTASIAYRLWRDSLCPGQQPQPMGAKSD